MPTIRVVLAVPLLLISAALVILAAAQAYVIVDGVARFGFTATAAWPSMGFRLLTFAVPGVLLGLGTYLAFRRR